MSDENTEETTTETVARSTAVGVGIAGMIVVGLIGLFAGSRMAGEVEVARAPTAAELEVACAPEIAGVEDELSTAQAKVADLERNAAETQGQIADLESSIATGAKVGKAMRAELAMLKENLAVTEQKLAAAVEEKEALLVELKDTQRHLQETQETLVVRTEQRDDAREDALFNRFDDFLSDSQLEICDRGNRKRLGNCREEVLAALKSPARRDQYSHCIRSGQAEPVVRELLKDATLPEFAEMMNEEVKQVKGWYIEMCDPTLPEVADVPLAEGRLPRNAG